MSLGHAPAPFPSTASAIQVCPSCESPRDGEFCPHCGEKAVDHHDYSLSHFFGHAFHEVFHVDGKIFRTLRVLLTRPGQLTLDYFKGMRTPYVPPFRLVLTIFALQLALYSFYQPTSMFRFKNLGEKTYGQIEHMLAKRADAAHIPTEQVIESVEERWHHGVSVAQFSIPFLFAIALAVAFAGQRRFFVEHLVFAMHYMSLSYVVTLVIWPLYAMFGLIGPKVAVVKAFAMVATIAYLLVSAKRFYQRSWPGTVGRCGVSLVGYFVSIMVPYIGAFVYALVVTMQSLKHG